jgi:hypothetical protein
VRAIFVDYLEFLFSVVVHTYHCHFCGPYRTGCNLAQGNWDCAGGVSGRHQGSHKRNTAQRWLVLVMNAYMKPGANNILYFRITLLLVSATSQTSDMDIFELVTITEACSVSTFIRF